MVSAATKAKQMAEEKKQRDRDARQARRADAKGKRQAGEL
jgi:hypothetical protein